MYETLAEVYDEYMEEVPYGEWLLNVKRFIEKYGKGAKRVIDLGCGTGSMTKLLYEEGFEVLGIDLSEEMLGAAAEKTEGTGIVLSRQDMREFEVLGEYDVIVSLCDCMNYLTEDGELLAALKRCYKALSNGGILIFDLNSVYKLAEVLGCGSFCETRENSAFTCENCYDEESRICEYYVNFFIEEDGERYRRFEECHYERAYEIEEVTAAAEEAGFEVLEVCDAEGPGEVTERTERIYFVCRKE